MDPTHELTQTYDSFNESPPRIVPSEAFSFDIVPNVVERLTHIVIGKRTVIVDEDAANHITNVSDALDDSFGDNINIEAVDPTPDMGHLETEDESLSQPDEVEYGRRSVGRSPLNVTPLSRSSESLTGRLSTSPRYRSGVGYEEGFKTNDRESGTLENDSRAISSETELRSSDRESLSPRQQSRKDWDVSLGAISPRESSRSLGATSPISPSRSLGAISPRESSRSLGAISPRESSRSLGATSPRQESKGGQSKIIGSEFLFHPKDHQRDLSQNRRDVERKQPTQHVIQPGESPNLPPELVDPEIYSHLASINDMYGHPNFPRARLQANPYEKIGNSIFMDRAGVKMANLDAVFALTGHVGGYLAMQTVGRFTFCDLAGAPGAWSEYVQWRRPEAYGYGISLRDGIQWNPDKLDLDRMTISYGEDNTGDLYSSNAEWFASYVKSIEVNGVDLVIGDGGFNVDQQEEAQEFLTFRLILSECYVGIKTVRSGGNFVVKVYDTVTSISADLLYLLAVAFDRIILFKPISSRPANSERYVVCLGRRGNVTEVANILLNAHREMRNGTLLSRMIEERSEEFDNYLTRMNNDHATNQIAAGTRILDIADGKQVEELSVDPYRCLALWAIPDSSNKASKRRK